MIPDDALELVTPDTPFTPAADRRPRMPEPLPVRLVAVDDVTLITAAGLETELDAFYVGLLEFKRHPDGHRLTYHAENFDLRFDVIEPPVKRDHCRALGI